ncbi:DUF4261 domain-containing protein [Priestia filamentosa]|uniref:DUF4261 domain-containing protein n=1 Tax=Priestia filamentosa TaxID=1402861 RepID=UPI0039825F7D
MALPKIILGIPGIWTNRNDFKDSMARNGDGYVYLGNHIGHLDNPNEFFEVDISEQNPYIAEAMEFGGNRAFDPEEIDKIRKHKSIVYLISEGGSLERIQSIMKAASAILSAGGIAVNIESSGKACTKEAWIAAAKSKDMTRLFSIIIQMSQEEDTFYTTGMHCFGLRDVITSVEEISAREVATLFRVFCLYNLDENPVIHDGETFSLDPSSPIYLLKQENCMMFEEDDPFYNPYGVWNLVRYHQPKNG